MINFEIKNRWSGEVQFTAEIDCRQDAGYYFKLGLAVKAALKAGANLRGANLGGAYLRGANLGGANLRGADLGGADLRGAYLRGADLRGANLRGANLRGADLRGADLGGADLRGADLRGADLGGADLRGANLGGANLGGADLGGADLRGANLGGANLGGLILIDRATRNDGYEYFAWTSARDGKVIKAGCRTWIGEDAVAQARLHCETKTSPENRAQALRIVDMIEAGYAHHEAELKKKEKAA